MNRRPLSRHADGDAPTQHLPTQTATMGMPGLTPMRIIGYFFVLLVLIIRSVHSQWSDSNLGESEPSAPGPLLAPATDPFLAPAIGP